MGAVKNCGLMLMFHSLFQDFTSVGQAKSFSVTVIM
jgi:hypothetical protein